MRARNAYIVQKIKSRKSANPILILTRLCTQFTTPGHCGMFFSAPSLSPVTVPLLSPSSQLEISYFFGHGRRVKVGKFSLLTPSEILRSIKDRHVPCVHISRKRRDTHFNRQVTSQHTTSAKLPQSRHNLTLGEISTSPYFMSHFVQTLTFLVLKLYAGIM